MNLLLTVQQLITESKIPSKEIAAGAKVNLRWYHFFLKGKYSDPGVNKIQRLYDFLTDADSNDDLALSANNKPNTNVDK